MSMNKYNPKSILITGGAGFIGSHVCNRLVRRYSAYKITVLDKLDYSSNLKNLLSSQSCPNFTFIHGDICDSDLLHTLLVTHSIDTIIHLAAQTHVDNSFGNTPEFILNNVYGAGVLLDTVGALHPQIRRFIHCSTDEVYGETDHGDDAGAGKSEDSQLRPTNPYAATKAGAEMLVMAAKKSDRLPIITTRGNNVYGPHQFPEKLIPKFILLAMRGEPLPVHGDGSNLRSFLYCEDVAEAFDCILHEGDDGEVYNIGAKEERRVIDVAKDICKFFGSTTRIEFVKDRPFNDRRYLIDDRKLRKLGWWEKTSWEEGLKKTVEWYVKNAYWWGDSVEGALLPHPRMPSICKYSNCSSTSCCCSSCSVSRNGFGGSMEKLEQVKKRSRM
ncbi:RHAMNOSE BIOSYNTHESIS 2 [Ancistrocladus abbreviatus]